MTDIPYEKLLELRIEELNAVLKEEYDESVRTSILLRLDDLRSELAHYRAE